MVIPTAPRPLPTCPSCGRRFDESIGSKPSRVTTFWLATTCRDVYGRDLDDPSDPLVRLGTQDDIYYDFGAFTVGGSPDAD
jgi:hypothetical protein